VSVDGLESTSADAGIEPGVPLTVRLVEAGDQAGQEGGVQWRGHGQHAGAAQA
jgi:hypothetical protein